MTTDALRKIKSLDEIKSWRDRDHERWLQFRHGCPRRTGDVCGLHGRVSCKRVGECVIWYAINFEGR